MRKTGVPHHHRQVKKNITPLLCPAYVKTLSCSALPHYDWIDSPQLPDIVGDSYQLLNTHTEQD